MINYQRNQLPNYVVPPRDVYQTRPDLAVLFGHDQVSAILRSISASKPEYKHYLDRIFVENMDDVIHVLSFDGVFLYLSPSCRKVLEYDSAELALADELQRLLTRKRKRKRKQTAIPVGKSCAMCQTKNTPEWRRGPSGSRDLCNSCGLRWAKQVRSTTQSEKSV